MVEDWEKASRWNRLEELWSQVIVPEEAEARVAESKRSARKGQREEIAEDDSYAGFCRAQKWWHSHLKGASNLRGLAYVLPRLIEVMEASAEPILWRANNSGYQFQLTEGCLLQWWPSTGRYIWQGAAMHQGYSRDDGRKGVDGVVEAVENHLRHLRRTRTPGYDTQNHARKRRETRSSRRTVRTPDRD
jgi:hypothetical protein